MSDLVVKRAQCVLLLLFVPSLGRRLRLKRSLIVPGHSLRICSVGSSLIAFEAFTITSISESGLKFFPHRTSLLGNLSDTDLGAIRSGFNLRANRRPVLIEESHICVDTTLRLEAQNLCLAGLRLLGDLGLLLTLLATTVHPLTEPKITPSRMLLVGAICLGSLNPLLDFRYTVPEDNNMTLVVLEGKSLINSSVEESVALELATSTVVSELKGLGVLFKGPLVLGAEVVTTVLATAALLRASVDVVALRIVLILCPHTGHTAFTSRDLLARALARRCRGGLKYLRRNRLKLSSIHTGKF